MFNQIILGLELENAAFGNFHRTVALAHFADGLIVPATAVRAIAAPHTSSHASCTTGCAIHCLGFTYNLAVDLGNKAFAAV